MSAQPIGLDTALSRIQQIQSYQQQLQDPSAAAAGTVAAASPAATSTTATTSTTAASATATAAQTSFASLLSALSAGTSPTATAATGASAVTGASAAAGSATTAPAAVQAMSTEADSLVGEPYVWGGGHSGWGAQSGYDCSGFVSAVLHAGGYLATPQDTQTLPQAAGIESGPGQYVTIYDRTDAGLGSDHVIIDIGGQFYESGGEPGAWGGGGGVQKIATPSAAYLATFNRLLHPAGL